jgi:alpha-L-fucosidase
MKLLSAVMVGACLGVLMLGATRAANAAAQPEETKEQRDARMAWFHEAKFGLFIHWGVYAVPAGTYKGEKIAGIGEWIMNRGKIPVAEYKAFAPQFTASKYDPAAWVALAKQAGMKYIVITSKHHDGFALFNTKASTWNSVQAAGAKRDLIKPLAEAARQQGLKFGLYYSQAQDWTHPGGAKSRYKEGESWDEANKGSFDDYLKTIAVPQTREILTQYQPDILWWDTPTWMTTERAKPLHALLALRPGLITNNRLGGGFKGDTETPEQHIPEGGYKDGRYWEACMTMNDTWGYKSYDQNWKSTATLIFNLVDIASKGGNYLLNIGPTAEGEIPAPSIQRLQEVGAWMQVNGEAIHGSGPTCFGAEYGKNVETKDGYGKKRATNAVRDWRCTTKGNKLYIHLFKWPGEKFEVKGLKGKATKAYLLADRQPLAFAQDGDKLSVTLPVAAPDKIASVLCIELAP